MGKDEELGDIVMQKGCWDGGGKKGGEKKQAKNRQKKEEAEKECWKRETVGCVNLALGRQGKIAWARLAGHVCLYLIEEGCETQTPHWLGFYWNAATDRDGHTQTHILVHLV